jgi:hypothetical protein
VSPIVVLVIVSLVTASLRIIPGMIWPFRGMDAGAHLLLRRQIRRHRMRLRIDGWPLVLDRRFTYPWAFHWLLALLPESWLRRVPPLPSAVCDVLHAIIVVWLASHVAPFVAPAADAQAVGLVAGLLFGTSPALLVVGFGPRAYEVTPRPFGELLYTVMMAGALFFLIEASALGLGVALVAGGLLLLSSKFAAQVLVFCSPVMALLARDARLLLLLPAAFLVAMGLSGGGYWWILRTQWIHLRHYRRTLQYVHPVLARRNRVRDLMRAVGAVATAPQDRVRWTYVVQLAESNTLLQFLLRNVLWCGVVLLYLLALARHQATPATPWGVWLLAWMLAPLVPFLTTSLRDFRFLGEAERYPEYGIVPAAVLGAAGAMTLPSGSQRLVLMIYVVTILLAGAYTIARLRWNAARQQTRALDELVTYLGAQPATAVAVPLPWQLAFQLAPDVPCAFVAAMDASVWCRDYDRIFSRYPWLRSDTPGWRSDYNASLVVVDRAALRADGAPQFDFSSLRLSFDNGAFQVFEWAADIRRYDLPEALGSRPA